MLGRVSWKLADTYERETNHKGSLSRIQSLAFLVTFPEKQHSPDGSSGCPLSWNHSSMVVGGSPLLIGAEV